MSADVVVVLCDPADVRNVGPAIRAAANFEARAIRVCGSREFPEDALREFSAGALDTLPLERFADARAALAGLDFVVGTSRRVHDQAGAPRWTSVGFGARLPAGSSCGVLFGNERTGLSLDTLDLCDAIVEVPTAARFPSMNLGQAVACVLYELRRGAETPVTRADDTQTERPGRATARLAVYAEIERICHALAYPPGRTAVGFVRRLKRLLGRARANTAELSMVAGVFRELERARGRAPRVADPTDDAT